MFPIGIGVGIGRQRFASGIFSAYAARVAADGGVTEAGSCVDAVSTLLQSASLLLVPSGFKSGKVYSQVPTNGNGDLTFTRASTAVRTNSTGLLESMATGVPRLSYMYGSCPALLLEPQRTNLALQSETFDNASWGKVASSVTANSTTSPSGIADADTFTGDGTNTLHQIVQTINVTNALAYTFSIYAKKNTNNFFQIYAANANFGANAWANFDLNNGVVGSVGSSATATITAVGNGWYRCTMTATATATAAGNISFHLINSATSARGETNSLSTSVFLYGAQLELGAYATTYIPTTTATVTRIADAFSRNNIFTNGLISSSGGTWFVELRNNVDYTSDTNVGQIFVDTFNGGFTNGFSIRKSTTGRLQVQKCISIVTTTLHTTTTNTSKIAIKWNGTSADVFVNGVKQVSATAFTTTNMEFLSNGYPLMAFIQQMALYPTPLSDSDCIALTTL